MRFYVITVRDPFGPKVTIDIFGEPIPEDKEDSNIWIIGAKEDGSCPHIHDADKFCIMDADNEQEAMKIAGAHMETMPGNEEIAAQRLARALFDR